MSANATATRKQSPSPDAVMKCKKIGNYVLSDTIGTGTFSKVKLGVHLATNANVAIKILDKAKIKDDSDIERISREIHILKALRHPNIAQLYETITSERHIYIVMEYVEGKDLFQYIYTHTYLSEVKASTLFRQLISALEYIHTLGIVHRDIKPENILLDKSKKKIKLVDFGLSNSYKHGDLLKTACGSPCYASPEMIAGKDYNGLYSDLWSCGVVLYCMLNGKLPFDDEDMSTLYKKIKSADYVMPEYLSTIAKDFLRRILVTNPNKRITLDEIKKHPFFQLGSCGALKLPKGILIGIEEIPVDKELVKEIKKRFYKDKLKVTEEYIYDAIKNNEQNNLTTIYYLLLKQKEEALHEKKKCELFTSHAIKKLSFDRTNNGQSVNSSNQGSNYISNINNNTNNNNRFNVVVINNIVNERGPKTTKNKNLVTVNLDSQTKMNTSTSFNNNIITTKINLNDMISNKLSKEKYNSRNLSSLTQYQRNKTVSSITNANNPNSNITNFSINLSNTLNAYKAKVAKSKEANRRKFIFNSPSESTENFNSIFRSRKPLNSCMSKVTGSNNRNNGKSKLNKFLMKKIFTNDSFFNSNEKEEKAHDENSNPQTLNMTCIIPAKKKVLNPPMISNIKPKSKNVSKTKNPVKNIPSISNISPSALSNKKKKITVRNDSYNKILRNHFSLSMNKSHSKDRKTVSKEKKTMTTKNSKNNSKNKNKNVNIGKSLGSFIKSKKIGFGMVNFSNVIRKNISKEKPTNLTTAASTMKKPTPCMKSRQRSGVMSLEHSIKNQKKSIINIKI